MWHDALIGGAALNKLVKELIPAMFTVAGVAVFLCTWYQLPETVPIHFGVTGRPDGYGPKIALAMLPVISIVMYISLSFGEASNRFNIPWKLTDENKEALLAHCRKLLWLMKVHTSALLAYIQWKAAETALSRADGLGAWFAPVFLGGMFLIIGWFYARGVQLAKNSFGDV